MFLESLLAIVLFFARLANFFRVFNICSCRLLRGSYKKNFHFRRAFPTYNFYFSNYFSTISILCLVIPSFWTITRLWLWFWFTISCCLMLWIPGHYRSHAGYYYVLVLLVWLLLWLLLVVLSVIIAGSSFPFPTVCNRAYMARSVLL